MNIKIPLKDNRRKLKLLLVLLTILLVISALTYSNKSKKNDKNLSQAEEVKINKDNWKSHLLIENIKYNFAKVTDNERCYLYLTDQERVVSLPDYTESKLDCEFVFRVNEHVIYRSKPVEYIQELSDPLVRSTKFNYYSLSSNKNKIIYDKQDFNNSEFKIIAIDPENKSIFLLNHKNYKLFRINDGAINLNQEGTLDQDFTWKSIADLNNKNNFGTTSATSMSIVDKATIYLEDSFINISLDTPIKIANSEYTYEIKIDSKSESFTEILNLTKEN